jgi:formylglycine-generating enzyme required for sulfatase activity
MYLGQFWRTIAALLAVLCAVSAIAAAGDAPVGAASPSGRDQLDLTLDNGVVMKFARIPAGKFMMGSPATEAGRSGLDEPLHEVTISKPFWLGVTHVTVAQFAVFAQKTGYKTDAEQEGGGPTWRNPGIAQKDDHPVVCISHRDAKAFCEWLTKVSGKNCGLPTEAQWEYACRAGTSTPFCWGNEPADGKPWAHWNSKAGTVPVGSLKPNPWGLFDMHGNVLGWCSDCYGRYAKEPVTDPTGPVGVFPYDFSEGRSHVLRGGAWHLPPAQCRSAFRHWGAVDHRFSSLGFRVCVDAP